MDELKQVLRSELKARLGVRKVLEDDTRLFSSGLIDSLGVMEVVDIVESQLAMSIPPAELTLENFDSITLICEFTQRLKSGG